MNPETADQPVYDDHGAALTPTQPIAAAEPFTLRKVFVGADGIRAGWSLLIFAAIFAAIAFCINRIGHRLFPNAPSTIKPGQEIPPLIGMAVEGLNFSVVLLVSWIMSKIERRPQSVYGFGGERGLRNFLAGLGWGVVCISVVVLTLVETGLLVIDGRLLFGADVLRYGAIWLVGFLLVGLFEEYFSRGYIQYTLTRGLAGFYEWAFKTRHGAALGFWTAAIVVSFLFGLGHGKNPGESPIGLISAGLAALVFCLSLWWTGSLWWAIGFHAAWDWGQSYLYGVADSGLIAQHHLLATHPVGKAILSGGTTGPEGSIYTLIMLALAVVIIVVTLPRGRYGRAARAFEGR